MKHVWRARQDSNLRPSLFVVILLHRQRGTVGDRERHPVAVRLRSKPATQQWALELEAAEGYERNCLKNSWTRIECDSSLSRVCRPRCRVCPLREPRPRSSPRGRGGSLSALLCGRRLGGSKRFDQYSGSRRRRFRCPVL